MSAATQLFPEPECPCGRLLDAMGRCWACDARVRISPATTDLAGLLAAPSFVHQGAAVITTADGELTLRVNASGLVLDAERFGGALAAVVLDEPLTVALALAVLRQRGQDEALVAFEAEGGTLTLGPVADGVRLTVDRRGGAVASVTLGSAAALDLTTELLLSLRRRHWGMA